MGDMAAWHYNKNGQFTVRLAYKVFMAESKRSTDHRGGGIDLGVR
jgi:hypothetical protein